jgi:hypothetical protein
VPGSALLSRLAGWLAILAMAGNLCVGTAASRSATERPADAPSCCCGEGCACGPACACSVAPADPAEHLPEAPAPNASGPKLVPLAMPARPTASVLVLAPTADDDAPAAAMVRPLASGQRETRLKTGICTT